MYCLPQHLHDIKYITCLEVHFKMLLTLCLRLVAKQVNSVEATKKLLQMSHLGSATGFKERFRIHKSDIFLSKL